MGFEPFIPMILFLQTLGFVLDKNCFGVPISVLIHSTNIVIVQLLLITETSATKYCCDTLDFNYTIFIKYMFSRICP